MLVPQAVSFVSVSKPHLLSPSRSDRFETLGHSVKSACSPSLPAASPLCQTKQPSVQHTPAPQVTTILISKQSAGAASIQTLLQPHSLSATSPAVLAQRAHGRPQGVATPIDVARTPVRVSSVIDRFVNRAVSHSAAHSSLSTHLDRICLALLRGSIDTPCSLL